jgi:hypothetical protein
MLPFRKILFPVDYSEPCKAIVPYVAEMQNHFSAELSLLHAYGAEALAFSNLPLSDPELPEDTRLWAALQQASGGTWGGCVFDVQAIRQRLRDLR